MELSISNIGKVGDIGNVIGALEQRGLGGLLIMQTRLAMPVKILTKRKRG